MNKAKSNIVKMVVRGHSEDDINACINTKLKKDDEPLSVVEYAYGKEGADEDDHHPHMHVVIRVNQALPADTNF